MTYLSEQNVSSSLQRWTSRIQEIIFKKFGSGIEHSQFSSGQSLSCVWLFATPWIAARQASLSITNSCSSLKLTSIESVMPSHHLILCHPLLPLPSIFPSFRVFSNESGFCIRWPKYWSFNLSISPYNEYSGLISFRIDWLDLLAVQETLKSLLQHHSSNLISAPNLSLFQTFWIFWSVQHLGVWLPCCYWVQTCIVHSMTGQ